jgi:hypothetical protein
LYTSASTLRGEAVESAGMRLAVPP